MHKCDCMRAPASTPCVLELGQFELKEAGLWRGQIMQPTFSSADVLEDTWGKTSCLALNEARFSRSHEEREPQLKGFFCSHLLNSFSISVSNPGELTLQLFCNSFLLVSHLWHTKPLKTWLVKLLGALGTACFSHYSLQFSMSPRY